MNALLLLVVLALPHPTPTLPPIGIPTATDTPSVTATAVPPATATMIPTGPDHGPGQPPGFCLISCFSWSDLMNSLGTGIVGWLVGGINTLVDALTGLLTTVVRVDQWPALAGLFAYLQTVSASIAGALAVVGIVRYARSLLPGGSAHDGAAGLAMLIRLIETLILLAALPWGIGQLLGFVGAISSYIAGYSVTDPAHLLSTMMALFTASLDPVTILIGLVAVLLYLLVILVKLGSVALLAFLYVIAPLCAATWPLGSGIMMTWLRSFVSVALWGAAWGIWLLVSAVIFTSFDTDPLLAPYLPFKPFLVVALLLLGYGLPRLVDALFQAAMAQISGAYALAGGVIAGTMLLAGGPVRNASQLIARKLGGGLS